MRMDGNSFVGSALAAAALGVLFFSIIGCVSAAKIHARASVFGKWIDSPVDSEIARYYIETYLQGAHTNAAFEKQIGDLYARQNGRVPTRDELALISKEYSVDFASLFFNDLVLGVEKNKALNKAFSGMLAQKIEFESRVVADYLILFVPGWNYVKNGRLTGADFARPRQLASQIGFENHLVELVSTGSVEENAEVLQETVHRYASSGKKILIAGASSAGPVIHLALSERIVPDDLRFIKAWLNLGGILQGSPLLDYLQEKPRRLFFDLVVWASGWEKEAITSMSAARSRPRFERLRLHENLLIVNYIGIPLSGQLTKYSKDKYPLLRAYGPNDGLTLLTDIQAPGGLTITSLGNDHFIAEDPEIDKKTVALMRLIVDTLGRESGL